MIQRRQCDLQRRAPKAVVAAMTFACSCQAIAVELDLGNPDLSVRWDNTVRYNLGFRMQEQNPRLLSSPSYDESDAKFGRHDVVTNRVDLLSELDANYKGKFGVRVSAAAWYDHAYSDHTVRSVAPGNIPSSYYNDQYNPYVSRYVNGPSGEILDAFVWGNLDLGKIPVNVKVGRHTNIWGEGLLLGAHAISYSQSPVDGVKAVASPGIETKEVFLPIGQISAKAQVTESLALAAQYYYEWRNTRVPFGGTYLSGPDTTPYVDRLGLAPGVAANSTDPLRPNNRGNWGVSAKWNAEAIESTLGLYFRKFDDYNPSTGIQLLGRTGPFRFVYPKDTKLLGASFGRQIGPVSFGAELSFRKDGQLNAVGTGIGTDGEPPRGDTWHAVANAVYLLPTTPLWDTGSLVAELAYSRLSKVTTHPEFFRSVGYNCVKTGTGTATIPAQTGDKSDGCSTKDYIGVGINFTPQYLNILPSWNLDLPVTLNYGIKGNAPSSGGGFEGVLAWSVGARMTYAQNHEFSLRYAASNARTIYNATGTAVIGGNGLASNVGATDRGWLVFTYKAGF